jgi:CDP-glucose 4,6-dehydratase
MHYYVTGHTGFKGAWLTQLLLARGHSVSGQSLDPVAGSLFETAGLDTALEQDFRVDIRDAGATRSAMATASPDIVIHLAAQPLVRASYEDPRRTFTTNAIGTMNVLDAVGHCPSVQAHLVVTTDKVYRNVHQAAGYREDDALGGGDPYSASKAMADILTQSWARSFPGCPTAIARAGNVIGGGDVSRDRLLPDLFAAFRSGRPAVLRYPDAVRPWQHVLDCLDGYLLLVDALLAGRGDGQWNFGPPEDSFVSVGEVADLAASLWGDGARWTTAAEQQPYEAAMLSLNSEKARTHLQWRDRLSVPEAVRWTVQWERQVGEGASAAEICGLQLRTHQSRDTGGVHPIGC